MIDVILLLVSMVECIISIVLAFENLSQDALGACRLTIMVDNVPIILRPLNTHASSMDSIELVLHIVSW